MVDPRRSLGALGEQLAAQRITAAGGRVVARNLRTRQGEIDLVVLADDELVFVEVKTLRASSARGPWRPVLAVGRAKQLRLRRLARAWLAERPRLPHLRAMRFDVIGIVLDHQDFVVDYEHIKNAF